MPDADLTRVVETKFVTTDELSAKIDRIGESIVKLGHIEKETQEKTSDLGERFEQMGERVEGVQERVIGFAESFGVALGGMELAKKMIEVNSEAQNLQRTMGALISANYQYGRMNPVENFTRSMETSRGVWEEFQDAEVKFGLDAKDLSEAAGLMLPAFAKAKVGTKEASEEIVKLGRLSQLTGRNLGATSQALDMFLMSGMASRRNPIFAMLGISQMPEGKFTAEQRFEVLEKALEKFNISSMKGAETLDDKVNMLKARLQNIYEIGGKPLFDEALRMTQDLAGWMDKNHVLLEKIVRDAGDKFVMIMKAGATALKFAAEHADALKFALLNIVMMPKIVSFFDKVGEAGEKFGLIGRNAGEAAEEATGLGTKIGIGAKVAMVAAAFEIGWAIGTAIGDFLDKHTDLFKPKKSVEEINADRALANVKQFDVDRDRALRDMIDDRKKFLGAKTDREAVAGLVSYLDSNHSKAFLGKSNGREMTASAEFVRQWAVEHGILRGPKAHPAGGIDTEHAKPQRGDVIFNNAKFDIRQQFSEGFDPDRIAVALTNGISKLGERKLQSGQAPIFGVR